MSIVYSASRGEYSDYVVARLFKTREQAKAWILQQLQQKGDGYFIHNCNDCPKPKLALTFRPNSDYIHVRCPSCSEEDEFRNAWHIEEFELED